MGLISNVSLRLVTCLLIALVMFAVAGCNASETVPAVAADSDMQSRLAGTWAMDPEKSKVRSTLMSGSGAEFQTQGMIFSGAMKVSEGGEVDGVFKFGSATMVWTGPVTIDDEGMIDDSKLVEKDGQGVEQRGSGGNDAMFLQPGELRAQDLIVIQDASSDGQTNVQFVLRRS
jgi:hypothetical protein